MYIHLLWVKCVSNTDTVCDFSLFAGGNVHVIISVHLCVLTCLLGVKCVYKWTYIHVILTCLHNITEDMCPSIYHVGYWRYV